MRPEPIDVDQRLEEAILAPLARRASSSTICPSEAARAVGGDDEPTWRARRGAGTARGAIRIRRT